MNIALPSRASDAGPQCKPDERTASDFASEAADALSLYFKYRRENQQQDRDLRRMWLTEASRLLEKAIELEGE